MASSYELLSGFVEITTKNLDKVLSDLQSVEKKAQEVSATPAQVNVESNIDDIINRVLAADEAMKKLAAGAKLTKQEMDALVAAGKGLEGAWGGISKVSQDSVRAAGEMSNTFLGIPPIMGTINAGWAALAAGAAAATLAFAELRSGIEELGQQQKLAVGLQSLIGDPAEAQAVIAQLRQLAEISPAGNFARFAEAFKQLRASSGSTQQAITDLRILETVATGTGESIQRLAQFFSRLGTRSKITEEQLGQFVEIGIPIMEGLQQALGKTESEIRALAAAGDLHFPALRAALAALADPASRFAQEGEKARTNWVATSERMAESWKNIKADIAAIVVDTFHLDSLLRFIAGSLDRLSDKTSVWSAGIKGGLGTLASQLTFGAQGDVARAFFDQIAQSAQATAVKQNALSESAANWAKEVRRVKEESREAQKAAEEADAARIRAAEKLNRARGTEMERRLKKERQEEQAHAQKLLSLTIQLHNEQKAWLQQQENAADRLIRSVETPLEKFKDKIREALALLEAGFLNQGQFDKIFAGALKDLQKADKIRHDWERLPRTQFIRGTSEQITFQLEQQRAGEGERVQQAARDEATRQANIALRDLTIELRENNNLLKRFKPSERLMESELFKNQAPR
jgi:hypothetical protein